MLYKDRCVSSGSGDAWRALSTPLAGRADDCKRARRGPRRVFPGSFQQGAGQARLGTSFLTAPGFTLQNHWKGLERTIFIYELKFIDFPNRIIPSRRNSLRKTTACVTIKWIQWNLLAPLSLDFITRMWHPERGWGPACEKRQGRWIPPDAGAWGCWLNGLAD